jgi:hypothetical protein
MVFELKQFCGFSSAEIPSKKTQKKLNLHRATVSTPKHFTLELVKSAREH